MCVCVCARAFVVLLLQPPHLRTDAQADHQIRFHTSPPGEEGDSSAGCSRNSSQKSVASSTSSDNVS